TNDYAFLHIFGNIHHTEVLISFLNSVLNLKGSEKIVHVTLLGPFQAPDIKGAKETIIDVRCKDEKNYEYLVEMQILKHKHFDKRVLYYTSKSYSAQLGQSEPFKKLRPVIFLGILDFVFTKNKNYKSIHLIHDIETYEHLLKDFRFTFIE